MRTTTNSLRDMLRRRVCQSCAGTLPQRRPPRVFTTDVPQSRRRVIQTLPRRPTNTVRSRIQPVCPCTVRFSSAGRTPVNDTRAFHLRRCQIVSSNVLDGAVTTNVYMGRDIIQSASLGVFSYLIPVDFVFTSNTSFTIFKLCSSNSCIFLPYIVVCGTRSRGFSMGLTAKNGFDSRQSSRFLEDSKQLPMFISSCSDLSLSSNIFEFVVLFNGVEFSIGESRVRYSK